MPESLGITLGVGVAMLIVFVILVIVRIRTLSRSQVYTVKGKQVVVRVTYKYGAQLLVNNVLQEQFAGSHASRFTLRTTIDGGEFKAHITILASVRIEAYYQDVLLIPDSVGK